MQLWLTWLTSNFGYHFLSFPGHCFSPIVFQFLLEGIPSISMLCDMSSIRFAWVISLFVVPDLLLEAKSSFVSKRDSSKQFFPLSKYPGRGSLVIITFSSIFFRKIDEILSVFSSINGSSTAGTIFIGSPLGERPE